MSLSESVAAIARIEGCARWRALYSCSAWTMYAGCWPMMRGTLYVSGNAVCQPGISWQPWHIAVLARPALASPLAAGPGAAAGAAVLGAGVAFGAGACACAPTLAAASTPTATHNDRCLIMLLPSLDKLSVSTDR